MRVSSVNERKTQVRWVVVVQQKNVKMTQCKQHFSQRIPMSCTKLE
jgi:hypothetical protein